MESCREELKKVGISTYTRFSAIKPNEGRDLQDRINGCALSHSGVMQIAKEKGFSFVCVFEDDIEFAPEFNEQLRFMQQFIKNNEWHLLYFGGSHFKQRFEPINSNIARVRYTYTTHSYLAHESAYDLIMDATKQDLGKPGVDGCADNIFVNRIQSLGKSYTIRPKNIVYQKEGYSVLRGGNRNYDWLKRT